MGTVLNAWSGFGRGRAGGPHSWVASMRQERLRLMSAEEARQKQDKLRALRSHRLTDAEIDMMLAERRKVRPSNGGSIWGGAARG